MWDLNPHARRRMILSHECIPVPSIRHIYCRCPTIHYDTLSFCLQCRHWSSLHRASRQNWTVILFLPRIRSSHWTMEACFQLLYAAIVRLRGLEPPWKLIHIDLNDARIPIPPQPHIWYCWKIALHIGRRIWTPHLSCFNLQFTD